MDELVMEAAKIVVTSVTTGTMSGMGKATSWLLGKLAERRGEKTLDSSLDPDYVAELISELLANDPEFGTRLEELLRENGRADRIMSSFPPCTADFVDRVPHSEWLADSRRSVGTAQVKVLSGAQGAGKSELMYRFGHERAAEFPDGQIYIDFDWYRDEPTVARSEIATLVLGDLGVTQGEIEQDGAKLWRQYGKVTRQGRFLLAFDNVTSVEQVKDLVPSSSGAMLLISTIKADEAMLCAYPDHRSLGGVDKESAIELLQRTAGAEVITAERDAAEKLANLCDYQPYALRAVGTLIRAKATLGGSGSVSRVLTMLQEQGVTNVLDVIKTTLAATFDTLSEASAALCRLLVSHPGANFTAESAAAYAGLADVDDELIELIYAGILVRENDSRLRLYNLVRDFVGEFRPEPESTRRLLRYYRDRAWHADHTISPERLRPYVALGSEPSCVNPFTANAEDPARSREAALNWLETELAQIVEIARRGHAAGYDVEVCQLSGAFEQLVLHRGHHLRYLQVNQLGMECAQRNGWTDALAREKAQCGRILSLLGEFTRAEPELRYALDQVATGSQLESSVLESWSRYWDLRGDLDKAIVAMWQCVQLDHVTKEESGRRALSIHARMLANLLVRRARQQREALDGGQEREALELLAEAERAINNDIRNLSRIRIVQGKAYRGLRDLANARAAYQHAHELAKASGSTQYETELAEEFGELCLAEGRYGDAESWFTSAWNRVRSAGGSRADDLWSRSALARDRQRGIGENGRGSQ